MPLPWIWPLPKEFKPEVISISAESSGWDQVWAQVLRNSNYMASRKSEAGEFSVAALDSGFIRLQLEALGSKRNSQPVTCYNRYAIKNAIMRLVGMLNPASLIECSSPSGLTLSTLQVICSPLCWRRRLVSSYRRYYPQRLLISLLMILCPSSLTLHPPVLSPYISSQIRVFSWSIMERLPE